MQFAIWVLGIASAIMAFFLVFPFAMNLLAAFRRSPWAAAPSAKDTAQTASAAPQASSSLDLAAIVTAYKQLDVAKPLVESLLHQDHARFQVYLVADQCPQAGTDWYNLLHDPRLTLLRPEAPLNSKVRSLLYGREHFIRAHEAVAVFDPDNLATPAFLSKLDAALQDGFQAVQGRRAAKNTDSAYAGADAAGELYKNFIEREAPTRLGGSASIAGSGMAMRTPLFDSWLASPRIAGPLAAGAVIPAEDKILQNHLVGQGLRIPFRWDAVLYDEKVEEGEQVTRQRTRWTYSWFENIPYAGRILLRGLTRLDRNALLFGIYTLIPPLFLLILGTALLFVLGLFLAPQWSLLLALAGLVFVANIALSLRLAQAPKAVWQKLYGLPLFAYRQVLSLLGLGKARTDFLVTEKRKQVGLDEIQREEEG
jgi:cellulose synthase/poly-beta-1,6-N-acetylglucosamine synthase-like glycosyltransferase